MVSTSLTKDALRDGMDLPHSSGVDIYEAYRAIQQLTLLI
jgi:hypothetical protein